MGRTTCSWPSILSAVSPPQLTEGQWHRCFIGIALAREVVGDGVELTWRAASWLCGASCCMNLTRLSQCVVFFQLIVFLRRRPQYLQPCRGSRGTSSEKHAELRYYSLQHCFISEFESKELRSNIV